MACSYRVCLHSKKTPATASFSGTSTDSDSCYLAKNSNVKVPTEARPWALKPCNGGGSQIPDSSPSRNIWTAIFSPRAQALWNQVSWSGLWDSLLQGLFDCVAGPTEGEKQRSSQLLGDQIGARETTEFTTSSTVLKMPVFKSFLFVCSLMCNVSFTLRGFQPSYAIRNTEQSQLRPSKPVKQGIDHNTSGHTKCLPSPQ